MSQSGIAADSRTHEKWVTFVQTLNPDIDPEAIRLMDELRLVAHTLHLVGQDSLAAAGLSYAKYRLLMGLLFSEELEGQKGLNPSVISKRQGTSRNTISALIRDLEQDGLIKRHLDQEDKRKFNIHLTKAGRARVQAHASNHLRIVEQCFSVLSVVERERLSQLLAKLSQGACLKERQVPGDERNAV